VAAITHDAKLNDVLIDLGRSLLQYAAEGSLWSRTAAGTARLQQLAQRQASHVARLAELLNGRNLPVDFGGFPTAYTDLHFVSLEYLLPQLIREQQEQVIELDEAVHTCTDDAAAVDLLRDVHAGEQEILAGLQSLKIAPLGPTSISGHTAP
jgi:hypothetical protein